LVFGIVISGQGQLLGCRCKELRTGRTDAVDCGVIYNLQMQLLPADADTGTLSQLTQLTKGQIFFPPVPVVFLNSPYRETPKNAWW
jgi:hypothetical protein